MTKHARVLAVAGALALSGCGGTSPAIVPAGQALAPQSRLANRALRPDELRRRSLGRLTFQIVIPRKHRSIGNRLKPSWIPPSTESVSITLNTVNGNEPPAGLTTTKTTNVSSASCGSGNGCTVAGPASQPGSDNYTVTIFDAAGGTGHALAKASQTYTITVGVANTGNLTLLGIPATFTVSGVPSATAGTPVSATTLSVTALDAAGDTIDGTYASAITFSDSDSSGATSLKLDDGASSNSVQIRSNTDVVTIAYTGLAIGPATLTAHATGATDKTATFAPSVTNPVSVCHGGSGSDTTECATPGPQINLYATSGTGSSAGFTVSQTGWSNFSKSFSEQDTCSAIATITTGNNLTFTATVLDTAFAGTCTVTLTGGAGKTAAVPITFTSSSIGIFGRHPGNMRL
jgi:hypothetical protein